MPELEGVEIEPKVFAKAIEQLIKDAPLRHRLETHPVETLKAIGIVVADGDRAALTGAKLSQYFAAQPAFQIPGIGQVAETYVHVGVDVVVSAVVGVAVGSVVEQTMQEVMQANLARIQANARETFGD